MSAWDNYSSVCMEWELSNESCSDEHKEVKNAGAQITLHCLAPSLAFMGFCKLTVTFLGEVLIFPWTIDRKWFIFFLFSYLKKVMFRAAVNSYACGSRSKKSPAYIEGRKVFYSVSSIFYNAWCYNKAVAVSESRKLAVFLWFLCTAKLNREPYVSEHYTMKKPH